MAEQVTGGIEWRDLTVEDADSYCVLRDPAGAVLALYQQG